MSVEPASHILKAYPAFDDWEDADGCWRKTKAFRDILAEDVDWYVDTDIMDSGVTPAGES